MPILYSANEQALSSARFVIVPFTSIEVFEGEEFSSEKVAHQLDYLLPEMPYGF